MSYVSPWNPTTNEWTCPDCGCWNDHATVKCWSCNDPFEDLDHDDKSAAAVLADWRMRKLPALHEEKNHV